MEWIFDHQQRVASRCRAKWMSVGSLVTLLAVCLLLTVSSLAHEGHDLAPAPESAAPASLPRVAVTSELYELVGVVDGLRLTIYVDRFQDNAPVSDADINVTINDTTEMAERSPDGTYTLVSGQFGPGGLYEFVFDIRAPEGDDLLIGKVSLPTVSNAPW